MRQGFAFSDREVKQPEKLVRRLSGAQGKTVNQLGKVSIKWANLVQLGANLHEAFLCYCV